MHTPVQVHTQNLYWIHSRPLQAAGIYIPSLTCRLSANLNKDLGCPDLDSSSPAVSAACTCLHYRCQCHVNLGPCPCVLTALDLELILEKSASEARSFWVSDVELVRPRPCAGTSLGAAQGPPGEGRRYVQTVIMYLWQVVPPHFTSPNRSQAFHLEDNHPTAWAACTAAAKVAKARPSGTPHVPLPPNSGVGVVLKTFKEGCRGHLSRPKPPQPSRPSNAASTSARFRWHLKLAHFAALHLLPILHLISDMQTQC